MGLQPCILNLNRDNKELLPHGTLEFPCAGYSSVYTAAGDKVIPWHWHEEIELVYLESGGLKLQIPGKTFHLKQGQGAAINSNILHYAVAEPLCRLHSLVFHPVLIAGNEESVFASRYIAPLTHCRAFDGCLLDLAAGATRCTDKFVEAFEAFYQEYPGYEFTVRDCLSHICLALYLNYESEIDQGSTGLNQDNVRIQKMLDYIHNHYHENLELSQIARSADIGERECLRCFKRVIQTSPMQYLLKYRTAQGASMLLKEPGSSVSDIAVMCGFNSPSNFSQMFGRYFNCSPREYRRKNGRQAARQKQS